MKTGTTLTATILVVLLAASQSLAEAPIVTVKKELYRPAPRPGICQWCWMYYVGPNGQRVENYVEEGTPTDGGKGNDRHVHVKRRFSNDNGVTWTELEDFSPDVTHDVTYKGVTKQVQEPRQERPFYDPVAGVVLRFYDQCTDLAVSPLYHHTFYDLSSDNGRTYGVWDAQTQSYSGPAKLVAYEGWTSTRGDETYRSPEDFFNASYLTHNHAYPGNNTIRHSNGTVITALTEIYVTLDGKRLPYGSRCLIGAWDKQAHDYRWEMGATVSVPVRVSSRGLQEGQVAELKDGRILITWRTETGHRYYGVSEDGGKTISQPAPLTYSDGTPFYSPSSIAKMIRSSKTGKLYFIGNIPTVRPSGNSPRYPLVIAEIDETGVPGLKKDTVTVIDTRQPDEAPATELSNFSVLENSETHQIEMFVSPMSSNPNDPYEAPVRKYTLTFVSDGASEPTP